VDLVVKEPLAMFGTHPGLTGRSAEVVLGKKSGKVSITYNLELMGLKDVGDEAVTEMLRRVKERGAAKRGLVNEAKFKEIVDSVLGRPLAKAE
jgi:isopropylmalate/homocitrate/citramalate synthase